MKRKRIGDASFEEFRQGIFGNGGQNIYVSRRGILQRIHRFDVTQSGYADAFFANGQEIDECPPLGLVGHPFEEPQLRSLPALGAFDVCAADLNGDGHEELIVANQSDGASADVSSFIYWGGPDGFDENRKTELYLPDALGVVAADFDGDGQLEIVLCNPERLRMFKATASGFAADGFRDLTLECLSMAAADLDGDGCAELYLRMRSGGPRIYWGGPNGLSADCYTELGTDEWPEIRMQSLTTAAKRAFCPGWRAAIVTIDGRAYCFQPTPEEAAFFRVDRARRVEKAFALPVAGAVDAAAGRIGSGRYDDLVLAVCRQEDDSVQHSLVLHGSAAGFSPARSTALPGCNVRGAAVIELEGHGRSAIVLVQGQNETMFTTESLIYRTDEAGRIEECPHSFATHNAVAARRVRIAGENHVVFVNNMGGRALGDVPVYIYLNSARGFSPDRRLELPGHSAVDLACADFNDDGWADLLVANSAECSPRHDPGSFVYFGGPDGFRPAEPLVLDTYRAHGSAVGDFRHSGYLDIAVTGFFNPELRIFRGGPDGIDGQRPQIINLDPDCREYAPRKTGYQDDPSFDVKNWGQPRFLYTADFNNDGYLDLFVPQIMASHSMIFWGGPDGFSRDNVALLPVEGACCARAADLNGNGWLDLVVGCYGAPSKREKFDSNLLIFWGGPDGYSQSRCCALPAHGANSLVIADFNGDGRPDIFVTSYHNGRARDIDAYLYWNSADGFSVQRRTRLFNHSGAGCMAVDFDGDGRIDLAVCHHRAYGNHVASSKIWYNGPDGFEAKNTVRLPTIGPLGMVTASAYNLSDGSEEEYFTSRVLEIPPGVTRLCEIVLAAELQKKTWVSLRLRMAATPDRLRRAPWVGASYGEKAFHGSRTVNIPVGASRFCQYQLGLGAANGGNSPRVSAVELWFE